jgi:CheY-like chemotaxis protein
VQKKILVVDHPSVGLNTVSELLRLQGYHVEEAESENALRILCHEQYALIISDVLSDGLCVLENAKAVSPAVPVVLMSNEHILTRNEAIQLGADELIEKSELVSEQMKKIKRALHEGNPLKSALAPD